MLYCVNLDHTVQISNFQVDLISIIPVFEFLNLSLWCLYIKVWTQKLYHFKFNEIRISKYLSSIKIIVRVYINMIITLYYPRD